MSETRGDGRRHHAFYCTNYTASRAHNAFDIHVFITIPLTKLQLYSTRRHPTRDSRTRRRPRSSLSPTLRSPLAPAPLRRPHGAHVAVDALAAHPRAAACATFGADGLRVWAEADGAWACRSVAPAPEGLGPAAVRRRRASHPSGSGPRAPRGAPGPEARPSGWWAACRQSCPRRRLRDHRPVAERPRLVGDAAARCRGRRLFAHQPVRAAP